MLYWSLYSTTWRATKAIEMATWAEIIVPMNVSLMMKLLAPSKSLDPLNSQEGLRILAPESSVHRLMFPPHTMLKHGELRAALGEVNTIP